MILFYEIKNTDFRIFFELIFDRKMKDRRVFEIEINFMILPEKKADPDFSF